MRLLATALALLLVPVVGHARPEPKAGHIEVVIHTFVASGVKLSDFKLEKDVVSCVAIHKEGRKDNIRFDFYDASNVRLDGGFVNAVDLVTNEKSRLAFTVKNPDLIKTLKITRELK